MIELIQSSLSGGPLALTSVGILVIAGLLTSILSAVVGMAGGITLLSVMLLFLDPLEAIPLHGAVQLVSNSSRAWIQRRHIRVGLLAPFALPLVPLGFAGLWAAQATPAEVTRLAIGVFVLVATWRPSLLLLGAHPEAAEPRPRFFALGVVAGFLNVGIGATGPLLAPFFLNLGLSRFQLIGTKAACQSLGHLAKLAVFGVAGFAFADYLPLLVALSTIVVVGTWIGSRLLGHVSERAFTVLYKSVLTLIALRLVLREIFDLLIRTG